MSCWGSLGSVAGCWPRVLRDRVLNLLKQKKRHDHGFWIQRFWSRSQGHDMFWSAKGKAGLAPTFCPYFQIQKPQLLWSLLLSCLLAGWCGTQLPVVSTVVKAKPLWGQNYRGISKTKKIKKGMAKSQWAELGFKATNDFLLPNETSEKKKDNATWPPKHRRSIHNKKWYEVWPQICIVFWWARSRSAPMASDKKPTAVEGGRDCGWINIVREFCHKAWLFNVYVCGSKRQEIMSPIGFWWILGFARLHMFAPEGVLGSKRHPWGARKEGQMGAAIHISSRKQAWLSWWGLWGVISLGLACAGRNVLRY